MSAQSESASRSRVQRVFRKLLPRILWVFRKLVGLFVVYVALGSIYQSILADNTIAVVLYVLLGFGGIYLLANW